VLNKNLAKQSYRSGCFYSWNRSRYFYFFSEYEEIIEIGNKAVEEASIRSLAFLADLLKASLILSASFGVSIDLVIVVMARVASGYGKNGSFKGL
jgi:hypothetical protein